VIASQKALAMTGMRTTACHREPLFGVASPVAGAARQSLIFPLNFFTIIFV